MNLAWPFLAAGASSVVAGLWPIDDAAGELLVEVHQGIRAGLSAADAVARMQRAAIARGDAAVRWAGLETIETDVTRENP